MPGDPALPARDWDFPPWQAARLLSGAAQDAARAWTQPVPAADILDVTWDLQQTFRDLGIALRRLSRYRPETEPDGQPRTVLHEPATHISRAGSVIVNAGAVLRDREVLDAANRHIARGLPAGGDPQNGSAVVIAARGLADAAAMAYRIVGRSPSGTVKDRDAAVGAFMRVIDNLDIAVQNLAGHVPSPRSGTLVAARADLEEACTQLREALICSAVDFRQPGSGQQVRAMRERYPVLPHRSRPAQDGPVNHVVKLAGDSFAPDSVLEAVVQPMPEAAPPGSAARASHRLPRQPGYGAAP